VARALSFVASRRATGVLIAQEEKRRKEIYFVHGRMFHAATSEPSELTGEYLVARGLLDRGDLDFALAVLPRFDGRLGEALTSLGLVEPVKMFRLLEDLGRDRVLELFRWRDGELSFYDGAQPGKVDFPLDLLVGPLLEAGVSGVVTEAEAELRAARWGQRRLVAVDVPSGLHDAGWSATVLHAVARARGGIGYAALVAALGEDGLRPVAATRAVETARQARLLEWG
jgi:serine/threonine-protein kinase